MIYSISELWVGNARIASGYAGADLVYPKQETGNPILIRIGTPTTVVFELKNGDGEQFPFGPNVVDSNTIPYWNGEQPDPNPCGILSNAGGISSIEFTDNVMEIYEPFESMYGECFHEYTGEIDLSDATELLYIAAHSFNGVSASAITLPSDAENAIQYIGEDAFGGCMNLTGISIPNGVYDYIGDETFAGCISLTTAKLPTGYSLIPNAMFGGCMSLTSVTIPSGYREIGASAFADCDALSSVTIPEGITQIGHVVDDREFDGDGYAFANCALTSVTIPASVQAIADYSFGNLRNLQWIEFKGTTPPQHGTDVFYNIEDIIQERGENIPIYVPCSALDAYKQEWSEYATLFECKEEPFEGKARLTLSDDSTVIIPGSGELISTEMTYYSNTVKAEIGSACTGIGESVFHGAQLHLTSITISDSVTSIGWGAFDSCFYITSVTIPDSVTTIGTQAFRGCTGLASLTIGSGVTTIGDYAFALCSGLTSVVIPSGASIGNYAFESCGRLTSVTISNGITNIGKDAFRDCSGLLLVTIPSSVTTIGGGAFNACTGLTSIISESTTPPTLGTSVFSGYNCPIYVPAESVNSYKSASGWSSYASRIQAIP